MIKRIIAGSMAAFFFTSIYAEGGSIELMCKLDTGADVRYSVDLKNKKLALPSPLNIELDIEVSEKEILHEKYHNNILLSRVKIDRYSLDYTSYDGLKLSGKEWIRGKCETLKRRM
jgi:hypothetical protein